jgi:hypothetical protein
VCVFSADSAQHWLDEVIESIFFAAPASDVPSIACAMGHECTMGFGSSPWNLSMKLFIFWQT